MLTLAYRNLRARPGRTLLAALAIALGISMVFAMRIVAATVEQTATEVRAGRLAGADLEVAAADHAVLSATLATTLAARPDVAATAPIYGRTAWVPVDPDWTGHFDHVEPVTLYGVDPNHVLSPYTLTAGHFLTGGDRREVLLPAVWAAAHRLGLGDTITMWNDVGATSYNVQGLLAAETTAAPGDHPIVWMSLDVAQAAFGTPDAATQVLLRLQPRVAVDAARDRLRADLGPTYEVVSATGGAPQTRAYLTTLTDLALPLVGLVILVAGAFLVYNAFAITLAERRQEIGQLRLLGMTRGQVLRQTLLEALIVAGLGGAAGLPLGWLLGRDMVPRLVELSQNQAVSTLVMPADGAPLALGMGILVTLAAIFNLARQSSRVSPLAALQGADDGAGRAGGFLRWSGIAALVALTLFALVYAGTIWAARRGADAFNLSFLAPLCLLVAVLCVLPTGVRLAIAIFARATRHSSAARRIAARNLSRRPERTVLTTATLTIGLLLLVTLAGVTQTSAAVLHDTVASLFGGDFLLMRYFPDAGSDFSIMSTMPSLGPPAPDLQRAVDDLGADAEVLRIAGIHLPGLGLGPGLDNAFALDLPIVRGKAAFPVVEGSWDQAAQIFAAGPALTLSELAAHRLGVHPGDTVTVDTLEGKVPFRVALVGGPFPVITSEAGIRYFHSYPVWFLLTARPGHDKAAIDARLETLSQEESVYYAADPQQYIGGSIDWLLNTILGLFAGLTGLSGIIGGFGVVNTLLAAVLERQRELGMLRAVGMSRRQVRAMLVAESALVGLTGAGIGVLGGLALTLA
ncbi:MAG TPA: FtsX-like permease family protein, partial [Chloroflexia bacterium]|nr:FtsX-like permease family protein [Chloroflexia bacterium]